MLINPVSPLNMPKIYPRSNVNCNSFDYFEFENPYISKKPLAERKIINPQENINVFFDNISAQIFQNKNKSKEFSKLLKYGFISLSSSCYANLKEPYSAIGLKLDPQKNLEQNCRFLDSYVEKGQGVGINFSNFSDPCENIKKINTHFKQKEKNSIRPPAGIALLDINHQKAKEFIQLKNNENYNDWCFDLSVIIDDKFDNSEIYRVLLDSMLKKGEPGVIFSNDKNYICDSCAAAPLKENEGLTLAQINLGRFCNRKTGQIDYNLLNFCSKMLNDAMKNIDANGFVGILGYANLIDNLGFEYGSNEALKILENCLKIIKNAGNKTAISPTGTISRILKTTTGIDPKKANHTSYDAELKTMAAAQKYIDGQISKTIILDKNATTNDVDRILNYAKSNGIKGISVFREN